MVMLRKHRRILLAAAVIVLVATGSYFTYHFFRTTYYIREVHSPDFMRARKAIAYLGNHKVARAVPTLISLMKNAKNDRDVLLAESVPSALCQIATPDAIAAVIAEVREDSPMAASAAMTLWMRPHEKAVPNLLAGIESEHAEFRMAAAFALSRFDRQESIPGLVEMLGHVDPQIDDPNMQEPAHDPGTDPWARKIARYCISMAEMKSNYCAAKLRSLSGQSFGYKADKPREERQRAVENWREWIRKNRGDS